MNLYENKQYQDSIGKAAEMALPWEQLSGRTVLVAGATGLIGRCLIDILMQRNRQKGLGCRIIALSRSENSARQCLDEGYFDSPLFYYRAHDVNKPLDLEGAGQVDYVIHLASNTHPLAYAQKPIETIVTNIYGTKNLLDFCLKRGTRRFVFPSSVEIYGENRGDKEKFDEGYLGYLDSNTLRAGYPESKRVGEALCQAYIREKGADAVIPRLPRIFGPTMMEEDSKAVAQFIKKAVRGEDIILKSAGNQHYSFLYSIDAVAGIMTVMLNGVCGEAYNIADETCDATLREMAEIAAAAGKSSVRYELPDAIEQAGYSTATKARLDGSKIKQIGWKPYYTVEDGLKETITIRQGLAGMGREAAR